MAIGVGDRAPEFALPGTGGLTYRLSEYLGKTVVLVFYPGDNTPVCTKQLNEYNDDLEQFDHLDAQVLAVSPQSVESHEGFSAKHGFAFPLLADPEKSVFQSYGVLGPLGFPRRSVFVIDAAGTIRYAHKAVAGLTYRHTEELVEAVRSASQARPG